MSEERREISSGIDRRGFLTTGAVRLAAAASLGDGPPAAAQMNNVAELPKRALGKTGFRLDPQPRYVDEPGRRAVASLRLGQWRPIHRHGQELRLRANDRRLATSDASAPQGTVPGHQGPSRTAEEILISNWTNGWKHCKTDYVDLIFIHAVGDQNFDPNCNGPRARSSRRLPRRSASRARRGSSGSPPIIQHEHVILQAAARGGFVDAIMLQNNPWIAQERRYESRLDNCHKRGIGLISMKQVAGNMNLDEIGMRLPELDEKGLTPYQGLLHADLDRRAVFVLLRLDAQYRPGPRKRRGGPGLQAADKGRAQPAARRLSSPPARLCARLATGAAAWPPARRPSWAISPGSSPITTITATAAKHGGFTPSSPTRPATGPAPTSKPPARPAPTSSTSPSSSLAQRRSWLTSARTA